MGVLGCRARRGTTGRVARVNVDGPTPLWRILENPADHEEEVAKTAASRQLNSCTSFRLMLVLLPAPPAPRPLLPGDKTCKADLHAPRASEHVLSIRCEPGKVQTMSTLNWQPETPTFIWPVHSSLMYWSSEGLCRSHLLDDQSLLGPGFSLSEQSKQQSHWQLPLTVSAVSTRLLFMSPLFAYADYIRHSEGSDWYQRDSQSVIQLDTQPVSHFISLGRCFVSHPILMDI